MKRVTHVFLPKFAYRKSSVLTNSKPVRLALTLLLGIFLSTNLYAQRQGLYFEKTFEDGSVTSGNWKEESNRDYAVSVVTTRARTGNRSARFEKRKSDWNGDNKRSEIYHPRVNNVGVGSEVWVGFSFYIPDDFQYDTKETVVWQFHGTPDFNERGSCFESWRRPPLAIYIEDDKFKITNIADDRPCKTPGSGFNDFPRIETYDLGSITRNKWVDWVVHYKMSYGSDGLLEVWKSVDGEVEKPVTQTGMNYYNDLRGPFYKMGIYANEGWNQANKKVLFYDNYRLGGPDASYCDVWPGTLSSCNNPGTNPPPVAELTPCNGLVPESLTATGTQNPNVPANAMDCDLSTRWSAEGAGQTLTFDLGEEQSIDAVALAFYEGASRQTFFDLQISTDGNEWNTVLSDQASSGSTTEAETFDFDQVSARYVRYVGQGNSENDWNSVTEVEIYQAQVDTGDSALQAEDATVGGNGTEIESNHAGFNGSGFVNFSEDGGYVQFNNVDGGSGGEAKLTLRYALGNPDRTGLLIINGQAQPLTTPSTGSWSSWQEKTVNVTLQAGKTNTIRIATNGDDLANLDQIKVEVSTSAAVAVQARAKMLKGNNGKLSLRIDDQEVKSWTVQGNSYATYSASISEAQSQSSDIQLYFADTDQATDVQVDYLQIAEERYETEAQEENTATWQNNSCGGSFSDKLYCEGYVAFSSSNNARAVSRIEKGKLTSDQLSGEEWAYPNPTSGKVHLSLGKDGEQATQLRVVDALGREVLRKVMKANQAAVELDLVSQPQGMYFIHLEGHQQKRVLKVLKQ